MTDSIPLTTLAHATLPSHAFFSLTPERRPLFAVQEGTPLLDGLEMASCILSSVLSAAYAYEGDTDTGQTAVAYLIEMAKGIVDASVEACLHEAKIIRANQEARG